MNNWIPWAIVGASTIHIVEEYFGGWLLWIQRYVKSVTLFQFIIVNGLFLIICVGSALSSSVIFKLSIASLLFINALIHIVPTVLFRHFSPGFLSAVFLYVPLSVYAYVSVIQSRSINLKQGILASLIGALLMLGPILFQRLRIHYFCHR